MTRLNLSFWGEGSDKLSITHFPASILFNFFGGEVRYNKPSVTLFHSISKYHDRNENSVNTINFRNVKNISR